MAIVLSKLFMRTISQAHNENQTGISLWTVEDIERAQEKQRALALEQENLMRQTQDPHMDVDDDDDEYGDVGFSDHILADVDLDVS